MDAAQRSLEMQARVRQNAEEYKSTLKDLYSWEKEIKSKEYDMKQEKIDNATELLKTLPVRSHSSGFLEQAGQKENQEKKESETFNAKSAAVQKNTVIPKQQEANEAKTRGNTHVKLGEYAKAIKEYTTAIHLFPRDAVFYSNRALCHLKLEDHAQCIEDCDRAIQLDSKAVKAFYRRMQANELLGNIMDAFKDCSTILSIEPKNAEAKRSMERISDRLRKMVKTPSGSKFSELSANMIDIQPVDKPPYTRSISPLVRAPVTDIIGPSDDNPVLKISDEDIDKIFNSNCGPYVEVKKNVIDKNVVAQQRKSSKSAPELEAGVAAKSSEKASIYSMPKTITKIEKETNKEEKQNTTVVRTEKNHTADERKTERNNLVEEIILPPVHRTSARNDGPNEAIPRRNVPLPPPPTCTAQFYTNWKELNADQKYLYLKSIKIHCLCRILGAGFDSDTLADILQTLHDYYLPKKEPSTAATLLEVSKKNEVSILSLLMSNQERKLVSNILNGLVENKSDSAITKIIASNFNIEF